MRVTKYPQSCLLIEVDDTRVLIDPGNVALDAHDAGDFGRLDAVLYTHRHADHLDEGGVTSFARAGVPLHANADVCARIDAPATEVRDHEAFGVGDIEVVPRDLPHVEMVDGSPGPPNTGYVFNGRLFHPGDGMGMPSLDVDALAVPIAGPSISFRDAHRFLAQVGARVGIPIHYDVFLADPDLFMRMCDIAQVVVLVDGESTKLD